RDGMGAQAALLRAIIAGGRDSAFGMAHSFADMVTVDDFRSAVPVRRYSDFEPWIDSLRSGDHTALSAEPPVAFELTGGDGGARKLVPYTPAALVAFQRTVLAWLADLAEAYPAIGDGHAYFAISPALRPKGATVNGPPLGLASDAAYFGQTA